MTRPALSIIGLGENGVDSLTPEARDCIRTARFVIGGARHLTLAADLITAHAETWPRPIEDAIPRIRAWLPAPVAVIASGDPFFHGVGPMLANAFPREDWHCIPSVSCASLACARLGWSLPATPVVTLCGRPLHSLNRALYPDSRVLVLSADGTTPALVARHLTARGFGATPITLLEALGGPDEAIRTTTAQGFDLDGVAPLNMLALELRAAPGAHGASLVPGRRDDAFAHDGQITKQEIRAVTLAALNPQPGALLWDIGTGSGAIAIEWLLAHRTLRAIGIERDAVRLARAQENARTLGATAFRPVHGSAPAALSGLPTPDAIFIGGGARGHDVVNAASAALRPGGVLVVNAVTLETEAMLFTLFQHQGGDLRRIGVERLDQVGGLHGFRPAMTVLQYVWHKP